MTHPKITISSTGHETPEPVEVTTRKAIDGFAAGTTASVRIKNELGKLSAFEEFDLVAAVFRDEFDERTGRVTYYLAMCGDKAAHEEASDMARNVLEGATAKAVSVALDTPAAEPPAEDEEEPDHDEEPALDPDTGCRVDDGPFSLSSGPTLENRRAATMKYIEKAEKDMSSARSRMRKIAFAGFSLVYSGLPHHKELHDFGIATREWNDASDDLHNAQLALVQIECAIRKQQLEDR